MPPTHNVLTPAAKNATKVAPVKENSTYLEHLEKLASSGGHGVDLSKMSREEIRARLFGD